MASPRPTARISQLSSHLCAPPPPLSASPTDAPYDSEPAPASEWDAELAELRLRLKMAREVPASDPGRVRQAQQGKLMVRDRVAGMLDGGSLVEIGSIAGKGTYDEEGNVRGFTRANYVAGRGTVGGRPVVVGGDDFSVRGGHADGAIWRKAQYTEQMARELRIPLIRLLDGSSGGGSVLARAETCSRDRKAASKSRGPDLST
ncbi:ClpP/crotonase-like domain-containing protein [Hyaloraphidium curvatum]|nr:ClpP/crotonase-like domain-containing protein [Hyaloraphidium curvatum]